MNVTSAIEARGLASALAVPSRAQRLLAGRPIVIDGQTLHPEVQLMLRLQSLARGGAAELTPAVAEGREALRRDTRAVGGRQPIGEVSDLTVAGLPARLYTPSGAATVTGLLVFFHGGGFVQGDLETHDAPCRFMAEKAGVRVLSVEYALGPEKPFPAGYNDCVAAYEWVLAHADELGADQTRLAVGGDSAGGNLAAGVALEAARRGWPLAFQLLVYPATDNGRQTRSLELFGNGFSLTAEVMDFFNGCYVTSSEQLRDPRCSPLFADVPEGLAPAAVITAGFDPLRDEGEAYAQKLADAGVDVRLERFPDLFHGFFNVVGVGRRCREANAQIADMLRDGLA